MTVVEVQPQSAPRRARQRLYGLIAEYEDVGPLLKACRAVRDAGHLRTDAFTPFPVDGLGHALGWRRSRIAVPFLVGGVTGLAIGYFMMWYANVVSYQINVGGRPLNSWPAWVPIMFEMTVAGSALLGAFCLMVRCGLPRLHHPVFEVEGFERASTDRFFLLIEGRDAKFDEHATGALLEGTKPVRVVAVEIAGGKS